MIGNIKGIIDKGASRKLGETVVAGAAPTTGAVEARWPIAAIAMACIAGQTLVDTCGDPGSVALSGFGCVQLYPSASTSTFP